MSFRELAFIARATLARLAAKSLSKEDMNLLSAALNGMDDYALASLEGGARIEARDGQGRGALHCAAQYGYASTLRLLLDSGANPDAIDHCGDTPLGYAAREGYEPCVRAILLSCPNLNARNALGQTPLLMAARSNSPSCALALLDAGADPNAGSCLGERPLHAAASLGNAELCLRLCDAGADPAAPLRRSGKKILPADCARQRGFSDLARRLDSLALSKTEQQQLSEAARRAGGPSARSARL